MKKILFITFLTLIFGNILTSCVSPKKITYFQGADTLFQEKQKIVQHYDLRLKPADQVSINVYSSNPELLKMFTEIKTMGAKNSGYTNTSMSRNYTYVVNKDGDLKLPHLGLVHVEGLTSQEAARVIEQRILELKLILDPRVEVKLLDARVTVIGAVSGVVTLNSNRTSIIDVLSQLGDLNNISCRQNIRLFREENGKRRMYIIDVTSADVFSHPAYYVQQNDLIYIEPNKTKNISSSPLYTFLSAGSTILSFIITVINTAFWIKNK